MTRVLIAVAVLVALSSMAFAADTTATQSIGITVPAWNLIGNTPSTTSAFAVTTPLAAGDAPAITGFASGVLAYSSCVYAVAGTGQPASRKITGKIDATRDGLDLRVTMAAGAATYGTLGTVDGADTLLTTNAHDFITGIGSCYTLAAGPTTTFALQPAGNVWGTAIGALKAGNSSYTVTWTLTD